LIFNSKGTKIYNKEIDKTDKHGLHLRNLTEGMQLKKGLYYISIEGIREKYNTVLIIK